MYKQAEVEELSQFSHVPVKSKNPFAPKIATSNQQQGSSKVNAPQVNIVHEFPVPNISMNPASTPQDKSFRRITQIQDQQSNALQRLALTLPQPSMPIFNGNLIDYCDFIRSFKHLIESKTTSPSARLYYLIQHTSGSVQELMRSCLTMNDDSGYEEARKLLKERYGQNYQIAASHVQHLVEGPQIKRRDCLATILGAVDEL